jgi:hypothetical protein
MTAPELPYFKNRCAEVARELFLHHDWKMPEGLKDKAKRDPLNFGLAEWHAAKRNGQDPRWAKDTIQECWAASDTRAGFEAALAEKAFILARGDQRGHVIVDFNGTVHSLSRALGVKVKDVKARIGAPDDLRSVEDAKQHLNDRLGKEAHARITQSRQRFSERKEKLESYRGAIINLHRGERASLAGKQSLAWADATAERQRRLPRGLSGLWSWVTGKTARIKTDNESEAREQKRQQKQERETLVQRQREERRVLQAKIKELRKAQAHELLNLRRELAPHLTLRRNLPPKQDVLAARLGLKLER